MSNKSGQSILVGSVIKLKGGYSWWPAHLVQRFGLLTVFGAFADKFGGLED